MIRKIVLGSIAAAAFAVGGLASAPAQADVVPVYACNHVHFSPLRSVGIGDCQASFGAARLGEFFGRSVLIPRFGGPRVECFEGGFARLPLEVSANRCIVIR